MIKIGYLGPKGTFSHEALGKYIDDKQGYQSIDFCTIHDAIMAVENGSIDEVIVPMENSIEGAVNETLDLLVSQTDLKIKDEFVLEIKQNLLVKEGTGSKDIKKILSHPQPIGQCRKYINTNFQNVEVRSVYSTSSAAIEVVNGNKDMAAIGSLKAAEVYGLEVMVPGIQDEDNNHTRFVIISKCDSERTGNDKTSLAFSTEDKPGSLYSVLDIFRLWDINMNRIESRPAKNQLGKYIFFIDISGHKDDGDVRDALTMVKRKTSFFKLFGSYPKFKL